MNIRVSSILVLSILFFPFSAKAELFRNLSLGATGNDVLELQQFLNTDAETLVSPSGAGSSGYETTYFGPATKRAVMKFQEKYRSEVLIPAGLLQGTGYVGPLTRQKINSIITAKNNNNSGIATPPLPAAATTSSLLKQSVSGNLDGVVYDFNAFVDSIKTVGASQGMSQSEIDLAVQYASKEAEKQEYGKNFVPSLQSSGVPIISEIYKNDSLFAKLGVAPLFQDVLEFIIGEKVHASIGTPFGGRVLFPFFCTCSGNWLVVITPLPPTYVMLLTYYMGTQSYLSFNIPFTLNMVGTYFNGGAPCMIYAGLTCISLPNQGMISPFTGSSSI